MTEPGQAKIRNAQDLLAFMDERYPGTREPVFADLGPDLRKLFETASRTQWIPLEQDAAFVDAFVGRLGPGLASEIWTSYTARLAESPLQRALVEGATRLFGLSVGTFLRILPRMWATSYRGAGVVEVHDLEAGSGRLHIHDMHPAMCERDGYVIMLRALFRGMYAIASSSTPDFDLRLDGPGRQLHGEFRWR